MTGSPASVSSEPTPGVRDGARVLVCGLNWVGDTIMSMPALSAFRRHHPRDYVCLLVKPGVASLWEAHDAPDEVVVLEDGLAGFFRAVWQIRAAKFDTAYVLPNSWRAGLVPWLAGIPQRTGFRGHGRAFMLTTVVVAAKPVGVRHQACEYLSLLAPSEAASAVSAPTLKVSEEAQRRAATRIAGLRRPLVGLIPGAARGPSKQWPVSHFIQVGKRLAEERHAGIIVLGTRSERGLCDRVSAGIGNSALNAAGETTMREWAALLQTCDVVIGNDSGGMHVAAACGTPAVAIFGRTNPDQTAPLGPAVRTVSAAGPASRDVARDDAEARKSLASIAPNRVYDAALDVLSPRPPPERDA